MMKKKPFYHSKTMWINGLMFAGVFMQQSMGIELSPETQGAIIILVNWLLRLVTNSGLTK